MRREDLFHIARAAADVAGVNRVLVVGSQAVLGSYDESQLPSEAVWSIEADVIVLDDLSGEAADAIDGAIGYMSAFHQENGYYAEGVELETSKLPDGWEGRRLRLEVPGAIAESVEVYFPELHDLCIAKLAANRHHDRRFVQALRDAGLLNGDVLVERASRLSVVSAKQRRAVESLARALAGGRSITTGRPL